MINFAENFHFDMNIITRTASSLLILITVAPSVNAQSDDGFEALYKKAVDKVYAYLYKDKYGPVTPLWKDPYTFCYQTEGMDGTEYYKVDLRSMTRTAVPKDTVDGYRTPDRQRGAWGGFGGGYNGFGGRMDAGTRSPDGKWECLVRDHNIWVRNVESGELTQLSFDGNEHDGYVQYLWSADSRFIAAIRKQDHTERQILLRNSRPDNQVQPTYRWLDYDKPGDPLPQACPALFGIEQLKQIPIDVSAWQNQYDLSLGRWSADSRFFTFEYNRRGHQLYQMVAVNTDGTSRILAQEESSTFVYYNDLYRHWMNDRRHILWISERDDWRHL